MPAPRLRSLMPSMSRYGIILSALFFMIAGQAYAGIIVGGTRFVMQEKQKSISFFVKNTDADTYLIHTRIKPATAWAGGVTPPQADSEFIATPPLFSLSGGKENIVRIMATALQLPQDRETLLQLEVAAIPSGKSEKNSLQMAINSKFKLLWRPSGLKGNVDEAYTHLKWALKDGEVKVSNPTPYVVTLSHLQIDGIEHNAEGVVMPFSERSVPRCSRQDACRIKWQTIDDFGKILPAVTAQIVSSR